MIDLITLNLIAGNGGKGSIHFRREKYVPRGGPDGGSGGDGGHVVIVGNRGLTTLKHLAGVAEMIASSGEDGRGKKKFGAKSQNLVIEVPLGTVIWLVAENETSRKRSQRYGWWQESGLSGLDILKDKKQIRFTRYYSEEWERENKVSDPSANSFGLAKDEVKEIDFQNWSKSDTKKFTIGPRGGKKQAVTGAKLVEINQHGQTVTLCQGGFGGRGNTLFKSSTNTTPREAELGTAGECKKVVFELRLLADVGLVGFPNAGKSTLLSKITQANPKIASYPFTTLEPNLGILSAPRGKGSSSKSSLIVADIPGLIEGASQGKGLGLDFLRHIENCNLLLFVLFLEERVVFDDSLSDLKKARLVWRQFQSLQKELKYYAQENKSVRSQINNLIYKPRILSLNKIDIYSSQLIDTIIKVFNKKGEKLMPFSAITGQGLSELGKVVIAAVK